MRDWPHSPVHRLVEAGAYMVTAGTYLKKPLFNTPPRLNFLHDTLLDLADALGWQLQAWAVFANHYHFVALSPPAPETLVAFIRRLHSVTAREINRLDSAAGRRALYEYWDTHLTYQKSYLARLAYVHRNALHHGLVRVPSAYPWCSAAWFERKANRALFRTVMSFPCDRIKVPDDFPLECGSLLPL